MDFMFEDEVDEVGSDVEAYCPKCKADTTHVVISKYEDEIRRVQCNPCGDVHSFRKPRGEVEDDVPEPIAAKKRALLKKMTWDEFFAKHSEKNGKPYEFREAYSENAIVTHPKFGRGFVSEVMSDSKVEITFKDARRVLVHNRKDMPGLPLAAEGDGIPSKGAKAKAVKNKAAKEDKSAAAAAKAVQAPKPAPVVADKRAVGKKPALAPAAVSPPKVAAKAPPAAPAAAPAKAAKPAKVAVPAAKSAKPVATPKPAATPKAAKQVPKPPAKASAKPSKPDPKAKKKKR
jgi:Zn ribbon nucleic-acid-binding protein